MRALLPVLLAAALASHSLLLALEKSTRSAWRLPLLAALALAASIGLRLVETAPLALQSFADAFALVTLAASVGEADARAAGGPWPGWLHRLAAVVDGSLGALLYAWLLGLDVPAGLAVAPIAILLFALAWPALQARIAAAPLAPAWREGPATLLALALPALALAGLWSRA